MTLDELRAALDALDLPGDTLVVLAKDSEGNGFSPLDEAAHAMYLADTTWSGEHYMTEEQVAADPDADEEEDGPPDGSVPAVFLWPTN